MWSLKQIILRGTGRGSRLHVPNCIASMDDSMGATNEQCDLHAEINVENNRLWVL